MQTVSKRHKDRGHMSCFWCLSTLWPTKSLRPACETLHANIQMARGRKGKIDPRISFRLDALTLQLVLPDSAQRPIQTGQRSERPRLTLTLCGRGTSRQMLPATGGGLEKRWYSVCGRQHTWKCRREEDREGNWMLEQQCWGGRDDSGRVVTVGLEVVVVVVGCGCKRRNKSSQSNLWQWLLQCH